MRCDFADKTLPVAKQAMRWSAIAHVLLDVRHSYSKNDWETCMAYAHLRQTPAKVVWELASIYEASEALISTNACASNMPAAPDGSNSTLADSYDTVAGGFAASPSPSLDRSVDGE